jgi:hypothetical protein
MSSPQTYPEKILKSLLVISALVFLYGFVRDSYQELFFNQVHFFEDAYMFIRYAKIWHLGYGEAWNVGEGAVYGNTSQLHFLFVLLLTSFKSLSDNAIVKISSFVPAFVFMTWLPWFCARHSPLFAAHALWQRYALWLGTICPLVYRYTPFGYHDLTGMDTSLSILLHLLLLDAVLCYEKSRRTNTLIAVIALSYLAYLARPENLLAATLLVTLYFSLRLKDYRALGLWMAAMLVIVALDGLVKYEYFGDAVPLAFYAKKAGYIRGNLGAGFSHPLFYFFSFLLSLLPFVIAQIFFANKTNFQRQVLLVLPAIVTIAYFFTMMTVMNMKARYFYPFTPYFIAAAITSADPHMLIHRPWLRWPLFVIGYIVLFLGLTLADQNKGDIVNAMMGKQTLCDDSLKTPAQNFGGIGYRIDTEGFDHLVNVLRDDAPEVTVAMTENGYVGAKLPQLHIIDMTGLHNRYIARHGFSAEWVLAQQPDLIWMPHWHYTCMTHDILASDEFWLHYHFYPGVFSWGLALRMDGGHYNNLYRKLDQQLQVIYPGYPLVSFEKTRN